MKKIPSPTPIFIKFQHTMDKEKILDTSKKRKKENEPHEKIKNQNAIRFLDGNNDTKSQGNDAFEILRTIISNLHPIKL